MRLTINLDDDLYAMARSHAIATRTSLSKAVGDLLRQRTAPSGVRDSTSKDEMDAPSYFDPILGIQVSRCDKPLTGEAIQRDIDDDDIRIMEAGGWISGGEKRS